VQTAANRRGAWSGAFYRWLAGGGGTNDVRFSARQARNSCPGQDSVDDLIEHVIRGLTEEMRVGNSSVVSRSNLTIRRTTAPRVRGLMTAWFLLQG
jgi:hypothetical protein